LAKLSPGTKDAGWNNK